MPLIGELTVTCLPDVSSGEVFAMDFPVDDGVSCLATNTMKIKKPRRTELSMAPATGLEPVTVRLTVPALTAIGASVTLASDDTAIADFVMWEAELMEDLNPDSVEEMFPIPRAEAHA